MLFLKIATITLSLSVTGLGLASQARKNYTRKSTEGLSLLYFSLLAVSYSFWTAYGVVGGDVVLIIPMALGMIMSWAVFAQFFLYQR